MPIPLNETERYFAMKAGEVFQKETQEGEKEPKPVQQKPSLSLGKRLLRTIEQITTLKGT